MDESLTGSWRAESSNIPGYVPGREWLHFSAKGLHTIEALHPGQNTKTVKNEFTMQREKGTYRFQPTKKLPDGSPQGGWRVLIVRLNPEEIAVTPDLPKHGFTTVYRRVIKPQSNQPAQHNAGSRPSSGNSPAPETPSAPAPRG